MSFLDTHILTEAYIRRIVYLGCRNIGFAHFDAQHIATYQFIKSARLYTTLFEMLSGDPHMARSVRRKHRDFDELIKLYEDYSCIYRNRVVHGAATLTNAAFKRVLVHIDVSFVMEFERVLIAEFGQSAFDEPKKWSFHEGRRCTNFEAARTAMASYAQQRDWGRTFGGEKLLSSNIHQNAVAQRLRNTEYGCP